jgi:ABC-type glycerol-3-phosphate transport system substrate-binding protein
LDGLGWSVMAQSKNPAMSADFLFSALNPEEFDTAVKEDTDKGLKPFSTKSIDMPFKSLFTRKAYTDDPFMGAFFKVALEAKNVYSNPVHLPEYTFLVNSVVLPSFQKVLLGKQSVEEAAGIWAGEFTKVQKAFLARPKT